METDFTNETIEKMLLKRALSDKNWLRIVSNIHKAIFKRSKGSGIKSLFQDQMIKLIFDLAIKFYDKYDQCPSNKVIQLLGKKYQEAHPEQQIDQTLLSQTLLDISNTSYLLSDDILNQNFKSFLTKQAFYESLSNNAELLTSGRTDFQYVVDECLSNFESVQKITFDDSNLGMNYFDDEAMKQHWEFIKNPEAKIKTGWAGLDEYTNGGFLKDGRMLALIMAQAGLGKSVFLSNLAVNFLKQNLSVVVISLEMSENVYAQRFDAHISNKNINRLRENEESACSRIKSFYAKYPKSNLFIKEYPPRTIRSADIQSYLENLKNAGHNFDVVIIDYLNLVLPNKGSDSMYKDGLSVSEELRSLSYKFNCPIISATQCNSEGMNSETIDMQNVSESRGIVHTVDFLAALMQKQEERENGIINMRILKNRLGGQVGKICNFKMDKETLTVADITFDAGIGKDILSDEDDEEFKLDKILGKISSISSDVNSDLNSF